MMPFFYFQTSSILPKKPLENENDFLEIPFNSVPNKPNYLMFILMMNNHHE